jgi:hypothetical protein
MLALVVKQLAMQFLADDEPVQFCYAHSMMGKLQHSKGSYQRMLLQELTCKSLEIRCSAGMLWPLPLTGALIRLLMLFTAAWQVAELHVLFEPLMGHAALCW